MNFGNLGVVGGLTIELLADCFIVYLLLLFSFSFCEAISDFDEDFANDDELSDDEDED